ncbi:sensor histidine kinase, partial [Streptomyces galbus]
MNTHSRSDEVRARTRAMVLAAVRGLTLAVAMLPVSILCLVLTLLSIALVPIGVGLVTTPAVLAAVRAFADARRRLAADWCGVRIETAYRPLPEGANPWTRTFALLRDRQTWRDVLLLPVDMTAGFFTALLPGVLVFYAVEGFALALGLWRAYAESPGGTYWYAFLPVSGPFSALGAIPLACGFLFLGYRYGPRLLTAHFRLTRAVLTPSQEELAERVRVLTETRRDAVDASAAELRRIERDLHDGAQARLVAMGMDLGTVEVLIDKDPERARALLAQARQSSADALAELRDLVRGIHPPVLAERGLGDAVRALALRLPVPTEVSVDLAGRPEAPVESAAYFAVSEALSKAGKQAGAYGRPARDTENAGCYTKQRGHET